MRVPQSTLVFSFPVPHQRLDVLNLNTNYVGECMALGPACISSIERAHCTLQSLTRDYTCSTGSAKAGEIEGGQNWGRKAEHGAVVFAQNTSVAKLYVCCLCVIHLCGLYLQREDGSSIVRGYCHVFSGQ